MCAMNEPGRTVRRTSRPYDTPPKTREGKKRRFTLRSAFACAGSGIGHAFLTQRNVKIQLVFALAAIVLGIILRISPVQWCIIVLCIMIVLALELVNTAIESVVDLVSPEYSNLARIAKNCAAGAVLLCAIGSVVIAAIIFIQRLLALGGV